MTRNREGSRPNEENGKMGMGLVLKVRKMAVCHAPSSFSRIGINYGAADAASRLSFFICVSVVRSCFPFASQLSQSSHVSYLSHSASCCLRVVHGKHGRDGTGDLIAGSGARSRAESADA